LFKILNGSSGVVFRTFQGVSRCVARSESIPKFDFGGRRVILQGV
jgi:hypothetical protein